MIISITCALLSTTSFNFPFDKSFYMLLIAVGVIPLGIDVFENDIVFISLFVLVLEKGLQERADTEVPRARGLLV